MARRRCRAAPCLPASSDDSLAKGTDTAAALLPRPCARILRVAAPGCLSQQHLRLQSLPKHNFWLFFGCWCTPGCKSSPALSHFGHGGSGAQHCSPLHG